MAEGAASGMTGGDSKYGRLFTEADVERIIAEALIEQHKRPQVRAAVVIADVMSRTGEFTFPADEPLFLLRGQDEAIVDTLYEYKLNCSGCSPEHQASVAAAVDAIRKWQVEHPDRVKAAD